MSASRNSADVQLARPTDAAIVASVGGMQPSGSAPTTPFLPGRHFAITWGIPDSYGGMTNAMFHRTRAFVEVGGVSVDVLTLDARPDYPEVERRLRDSGQIVDGIRLLNLWDWLRTHPLPGGSLNPSRHPLTPLDRSGVAPDLDAPAERDGVPMSRVRRAPDGTVLQTDYYRVDGSLLASDRRDVRERGVVGGRAIVLCDERGEPVRSWGRVRDLYTAWLDALTAKQQSWLIIDSKSVANLLLEYRRSHVVTAHIVHASHLVGQTRPLGTLRPSRKPVFDDLGAYDSIVVLTERQKSDIEAMLGHHENLAVVPNARSLGEAPGGDTVVAREPGAGIMLAALTKRKRVAHAIRAVAAVSDDTGVHLDIYGDGELRDDLAAEIDGLDAGGRVRLRGHDTAAAARLTEASFLLLTSTSEGFPLVLVESLAAGCIPIAYDIPYGPSDIVEDGVNGFLVPAGDVAGLTDAIERLASLDEAALERMRSAARASAARFSDERVTADWMRELTRAAVAKKTAAARSEQLLKVVQRAPRAIARRLRSLRSGR